MKNKTIDLHQVDAFTDQLFGGNPAGVVTNADDLTDEEMQKIAREMNLSETAFVLQPTTKDADIRLRYFTPEAEVSFCGHATIGTLCELARLKLHGLGHKETNIRVETEAGIFAMSSGVRSDKATAVFTMPKPTMKPYRLQGEAFAAALGIPPAALQSDGTILHNTDLNDLFVPIKSPEALGQLRFDFPHIREQFATDNIVAFGLFAALDHAKTLDVRGLAPLVGVDEDPFTGRLQAALMLAAKHNGHIPEDQNEIVTRQGHYIGRPGEAHISIDPSTSTTKITGGGVHVFSTVMELPQ